MSLTLKLSDEQAIALQAKAAADSPSVEQPLQTAADIILSRMRNVRPEIMATMSIDGANQYDHYIYCWPKKEA